MSKVVNTFNNQLLPYADPGADSFDQLDAMRIQRHHIQQLEQLGFAVTLTPKEAA